MRARRMLNGHRLTVLLGTSAVYAPDEAAGAANSSSVNEQLWHGDHVARYANRSLRPVEVILLARYQQALSGRVLEIGCGAGRILGYLVALGGEVHGVDVSSQMVDYCRRTYPEAHVHVGDLRRLPQVVSGPLDAVIAPDNVLDVVDPTQRREALDAIRALLAPDGRLIFSSHNLAAVGRPAASVTAGPGAGTGHGTLRRLAHSSPAGLVDRAMRLPRQMRNRRRLGPMQVRRPDYAILNDVEGDYGALHYYVRHADQARQLADAGFVLEECLDSEGRVVPEGADGTCPWLHYVARPA